MKVLSNKIRNSSLSNSSRYHPLFTKRESNSVDKYEKINTSKDSLDNRERPSSTNLYG